MKQLINDKKIRLCPWCNVGFQGSSILEHERQCRKQKQKNQQENSLKLVQEQIQLQQNKGNINQMIDTQNLSKNANAQISHRQKITLKCEYCHVFFNFEQLKLHQNSCEAKSMMEQQKKSEQPSFHLKEQKDDNNKIIEILTNYFEIMEKYNEVLNKGEELVKSANFSIKPFTNILKFKTCKICKSNFKLDEDIAIMKCCSIQYHQNCFIQIISQKDSCECGQQIIF